MAQLKIYAKPSNLYRYRPLGPKAEQELNALVGHYIYCPAFSVMNDPMEGLYRPSARFTQNPLGEKSAARVHDALQKTGIASLSEVFDHEPMWAHYADQFAGMCVQYNVNRLLKGLDTKIALTRMMYSESEPVLLNDKSLAVDRARLCLSSKTVRWASEREWRLFKDNQGEAHYRDPKTVTKIFLGSRIGEADESAVRAACRALGVPVVKMAIDAYSLTFRSALTIRRKPSP
ncbi:hypothetical protein ABID19_005738 [Mesorhizobium robiniae]|uniref:DUF2971 domain-containing protein n=1 Tax=Mesorhizobium robiniae TaxID=559315 RepID=A0ABV2GWK6_9HYPH|nr:DUF2971 domain-containing protein [Mesorhizobium sp. ZC-5]MCV3242096.1 DUF2971 domain-containing protein [Mesorhizobium sp. ZC-5]